MCDVQFIFLFSIFSSLQTIYRAETFFTLANFGMCAFVVLFYFCCDCCCFFSLSHPFSGTHVFIHVWMHMHMSAYMCVFIIFYNWCSCSVAISDIVCAFCVCVYVCGFHMDFGVRAPVTAKIYIKKFTNATREECVLWTKLGPPEWRKQKIEREKERGRRKCVPFTLSSTRELPKKNLSFESVATTEYFLQK